MHSKERKLSDCIIPTYLEIENNLKLKKNLKSVIVTTGPASFTSLRVGVSFMLGLHFSKEINIAGVSSEDLLNFKINKNPKINCGIYIISANNQKFISYKNFNSGHKYTKLENNTDNSLEEINSLNILYYNHEPLNINLKNLEQKKYNIKNSILLNIDKIKYNNIDILKPIYISNNQILN